MPSSDLGVPDLAKQLDSLRTETDWSKEGDIQHDALRESFLEAVEHIATTKVDVPEATQARLFGLFHTACAEQRTLLGELSTEQLKAVEAVKQEGARKRHEVPFWVVLGAPKRFYRPENAPQAPRNH